MTKGNVGARLRDRLERGKLAGCRPIQWALTGPVNCRRKPAQDGEVPEGVKGAA